MAHSGESDPSLDCASVPQCTLSALQYEGAPDTFKMSDTSAYVRG
jgi:hypothetical protein